VLNADDPRLLRLAGECGLKPLLFGLSAEAAVRAEKIEETARGIDFKLAVPGQQASVCLRAHGRFMVANALAAAAAGHLLGIRLEDIQAGLEGFRPVAGRMSVSTMPGGVHLIDDTYNANPASMEAAIAALHRLRGSGRGLLVVGDMLELGPASAALHRDMGRLAARTGVSRLLACGNFAEEVGAGAAAEGLAAADILTGPQALIGEALLSELRAGDWVLVKGSRSMGMEAIVTAVRKWAEGRR
jgi:UDP-N-acetylmuramyl pentapeptide synthase